MMTTIHGLQLYYEVHGVAGGANAPLVLLHGGGSTIETSFAATLPLLAESRQVIAFEQQGHGHTNDVAERPFTFEQSAEDAVALLDHLHIQTADFFGYSNGATIALQIAIRHPGRVRKLVLMSGSTKRDALPPEFWEGMRNATLASMPAELQEAYRNASPHPEQLQSFHDKSVERMLTFQDIPDEKLRAIQAPSLIINGDHDVILPEHAVYLFRTLPHAQLAILPGMDHMEMVKDAGIAAMVSKFLG